MMRRPVTEDRWSPRATVMASETSSTGRKGLSRARPALRPQLSPETGRGPAGVDVGVTVIVAPRSEGFDQSLVGVEGAHGQGDQHDDGHDLDTSGDVAEA